MNNWGFLRGPRSHRHPDSALHILPPHSRVWQHRFLTRDSSLRDVARVQRHPDGMAKKYGPTRFKASNSVARRRQQAGEAYDWDGSSDTGDISVGADSPASFIASDGMTSSTTTPSSSSMYLPPPPCVFNQPHIYYYDTSSGDEGDSSYTASSSSCSPATPYNNDFLQLGLDFNPQRQQVAHLLEGTSTPNHNGPKISGDANSDNLSFSEFTSTSLDVVYGNEMRWTTAPTDFTPLFPREKQLYHSSTSTSRLPSLPAPPEHPWTAASSLPAHPKTNSSAPSRLKTSGSSNLPTQIFIPPRRIAQSSSSMSSSSPTIFNGGLSSAWDENTTLVPAFSRPVVGKKLAPRDSLYELFDTMTATTETQQEGCFVGESPLDFLKNAEDWAENVWK